MSKRKTLKERAAKKYPHNAMDYPEVIESLRRGYVAGYRAGRKDKGKVKRAR